MATLIHGEGSKITENSIRLPLYSITNVQLPLIRMQIISTLIHTCTVIVAPGSAGPNGFSIQQHRLRSSSSAHSSAGI